MDETKTNGNSAAADTDFVTSTKKRPGRPSADSPNKAAKTINGHYPAQHTPTASAISVTGSETKAHDPNGVPQIATASLRASSSISPHSTSRVGLFTNGVPIGSNDPKLTSPRTRSTGLGPQTTALPALRRTAAEMAHNKANGSAQSNPGKTIQAAIQGLDMLDIPRPFGYVGLTVDKINIMVQKIDRLHMLKFSHKEQEINVKNQLTESREAEADLEKERADLTSINVELKEAEAMVTMVESRKSQSLARIRAKENLRDTKKAAAKSAGQEAARLKLAWNELQADIMTPPGYASGDETSSGE